MREPYFLIKKFMDTFWKKRYKLLIAMTEHLLKTFNIYYTLDSFFVVRKVNLIFITNCFCYYFGNEESNSESQLKDQFKVPFNFKYLFFCLNRYLYMVNSLFACPKSGKYLFLPK